MAKRLSRTQWNALSRTRQQRIPAARRPTGAKVKRTPGAAPAGAGGNR